MVCHVGRQPVHSQGRQQAQGSRATTARYQAVKPGTALFRNGWSCHHTTSRHCIGLLCHSTCSSSWRPKVQMHAYSWDSSTVTASEQQQQEQSQEDEQLARLLMVKLSLAQSTGRLDLTDMRLKTLPPDLFDITELEDLSLAGNCLTSLPEEIGKLTQLKRLGLAGNRLTSVPDSIGNLTQLEGLWLHGNLITELPDSIGALTALKQLSLSGNQLQQLPDVWSGMQQLQEFAAAGNMLTEVPASLGQLRALTKLSLNGNQLRHLPNSLSGLQSLQELWLQGNLIEELPDTVCQLKNLKELYLGDNQLTALPADFHQLQSLQKVWLYSNQLTSLPAGMLTNMPHLSHCWLEGNPQLTGNAVTALLSEVAQALDAASVQQSDGHNSNGSTASSSQWASVGDQPGHLRLQHPPDPGSRWGLKKGLGAANSSGGGSSSTKTAGQPSLQAGWKLRALGLDTQQLQGVDASLLKRVAPRLKVGEVLGLGRGYFKLSPSPLTTAAIQQSGQLPLDIGNQIPRQPVLVVALGSAPGSPNWGGLLGKLYKAAKSDAEKSFDVLYVVDPARQWYGAGQSSTSSTNGNSHSNGSGAQHHPDDGSLQYYYDRLQQYTQKYQHVVLLGDSMGATAALLFAPLATHALAFCPQVDLSTSCMRPGQSDEALALLKERVLDALQRLHGDADRAAGCKVVALSGTWQHDLDQLNLLPADKVQQKVFSLESHRLALYLETRGQLQPIVQEAILGPLGVAVKTVRTANLL